MYTHTHDVYYIYRKHDSLLASVDVRPHTQRAFFSRGVGDPARDYIYINISISIDIYIYIYLSLSISI